MAVKEAFAAFTEKVNSDPSGIAGMNTVYEFDLKGENYQMKFADDQVTVSEGTPDDATCTLSLSESNLLKLLAGDLNPTSAFMTGRLKVKGDISLAMKLQSLLDKYK